jgi:H+/Cl- antiporter ClcA
VNAARVLRGLVLGAIGGFLGWMLVELFRISPDDRRVADDSSVAVFGAVTGLVYGLSLGVGEGITAGTKPKFLRAVGIGAAIGVGGGSPGSLVRPVVLRDLIEECSR